VHTCTAERHSAFWLDFLQVLSMSTRDIDMLIRLWDKFKHGVDEQTSC
jgi:hypothetical protein